ncbi:MAG: hypothetical protein IKN34_10235 [Treponema sp.]|nr:hypothetical protein [Treponema sp.]
MLSTLKIRNQIIEFLDRQELPEYDSFVSLCNSATSVLKNEDSSYRIADSSGMPGGLIDFNSDKFCDIPALIVPDLHARGYFVRDLLDFVVPGFEKTVLTLLAEKKIIVCCVGDIFHAESRARERWADAYEDFCAYYYDGEEPSRFSESRAMYEEMRENLSLLEIILFLKKCFPENFHVLKGNHENIKNATYSPDINMDFGNRGFRKFCEEGNMCCEFIKIFYDDVVLHSISGFESMLPICALFKNCVVSHAEPSRVFSRREIVDGLNSDEVVFGLTWTANDTVMEQTVDGTMKSLYKGRILKVFSNPLKNSVWIGGHRPVLDVYLTRQNGRFIQIHNPDCEYVSLVLPGKKFNPDSDIYDVSPNR